MIRIRKPNPKNLSLIEQLIVKKIIDEDGWVTYSVWLNNNIIGNLTINKNFKVMGVNIKDNYQRQGIATYLYDYVENDLNIKLKQSDTYLSPKAKLFWKNRNKK